MIVVVGLGNIGLAIAQRLVDTGQDIVGVDLSDERRTAWTALTGRAACASLAEVDWSSITHVFVIVRLTDQAERVLDELATHAERTGAGGLTAHVVTTLEPEFARDLARFSTDRLRVVETPVSGGESGARAGELVVMLAGQVTSADCDLLESTIATKIVRFDAFGQPTLAKLVNNVLAAYNARALADMLAVGASLGLDPRAVYDVVVDGSGGSWMTRRFADIVVDLLVKDVGILREHVGALPVTSLDSGEELDRALATARALLGS